MSFLNILSESELSTSSSKKNILENLDTISNYIKFENNKSKMKKNDIVDIINKIISFKNNNSNKNYREFMFGKKKILLDDEQYKIVICNNNNNIRIIAAAGSGKTTTIICRIKYLLDNFTTPDKILLLTFNVDSCRELINRINDLFGFPINIEIRTIDAFCSKIANLYSNDFGKRIHSLVELSNEGEKILSKYPQIIYPKYEYVFFDEFQDVNESQFNILKIFADTGSKLTVIGDDNQNIYQWRGSNNYYIINIDKIIPNFVTYSILTNYRSNENIINAANLSIKHNINKVEKVMKPCVNNQNIITNFTIKKPTLIMFPTINSEIDFICNKIKEYKTILNCSYHDFAILSRTNLYLKRVETQLQKNNLPYVTLISDKKNSDFKPAIKNENIIISTIHKAKGLEWQVVFLVGLSDKYFPSHINNGLKNVEEERRLFYVALTRPKNFLYIVGNTKDEHPISRFIKEILPSIDYENKTNNFQYNDPQTLFQENDENIEITDYAVTEIISLLRGKNIQDLRNLNLIPEKKSDINVTNLFQKELKFNSHIKNNNFEPDFGEFCDTYLTRLIYTKTRYTNDKITYIRNNHVEKIINGCDLTTNEMKLFIKYKMIIHHAKKFHDFNESYKYIKDKIGNDANEVINVFNKVNLNYEIREEHTYPKNFIKTLKQSYQRYLDIKNPNDSILRDIYNISLCKEFDKGRRRLIYRDIFDIFMDNFEEIKQRMLLYTEIIGKNVTCKTSGHQLYEINKEKKIALLGESDLIDYDNNIIIDFKCSENALKIEWFIQVLTYYSLFLENKILTGKIKKVGIFNILKGDLYVYDIPENYDTGLLLDQYCDYILREIKNDSQNSLNINLLLENSNENINNKIYHDYQKIYLENNNDLACNTLCFDVETGGFGNNGIVQLAYVIYDENFKKIKEFINL